MNKHAVTGTMKAVFSIMFMPKLFGKNHWMEAGYYTSTIALQAAEGDGKGTQ
jgi:hypothetical protein